MRYQMDSFTLNDGCRMPKIGFGTWQIFDTKGGADIVAQAIRAGYRHLDTASLYGSEGSVGEAWVGSGLPREDFFITSKIWKDDLSATKARASLKKSLRLTRTEYLDLLLIHWPRRNAHDADWRQRLAETWHAMIDFRREGLVKSIGVANFLPHHFSALDSDVVPCCDQIEFHVGYRQQEAVDYCNEHGIQVVAWASIGKAVLLQHPLVWELAHKYTRTPAQICLRFCLDQGIVPLVKSSDPARMRENLDCFGFTLQQADLQRLREVADKTAWSGEHPDEAIPLAD